MNPDYPYIINCRLQQAAAAIATLQENIPARLHWFTYDDTKQFTSAAEIAKSACDDLAERLQSPSITHPLVGEARADLIAMADKTAAALETAQEQIRKCFVGMVLR